MIRRKLVEKTVFNYLVKFNYFPIEETEPEDVFICGYPKSGNTWLQNLIAGVVYGIDTQFLPDKLTQELVPDVHAKKFYKRFSSQCYFKTHHLPRPTYKKVIHLVRDGRDAMVSYYAMNKALGLPYSIKEMVVDGKGITPCKWHDHTRAWFENPYGAEMIRVRYEDLLDDPIHEMERICAFANVQRPPEVIQRAVEGNKFQKMREKEKAFGWDNKKWKKSEKFIRKGKRNSFLEEMPKELILEFEKEAHEELVKLNYEMHDKIAAHR